MHNWNTLIEQSHLKCIHLNTPIKESLLRNLKKGSTREVTQKTVQLESNHPENCSMPEPIMLKIFF